MTTTLVPGLLRTVARNASRGATDLAIFETAQVTIPHEGQGTPILAVDRRPDEAEWAELVKALPEQPTHLAFAVAGDRDRRGWWGAGRPASWSDVIETARVVAGALGLELTVRAADLAPWHPGRCAELLVGEVSVGHAGELHPKVCRAFGVPARTAVAELDLDALVSRAVPVRTAPDFSTFPVAKEDVALVVDESLPAEELAATLREGAGVLCESVRLFDLYTGEQVPQGRKSLAFALRFRATDRTLTEKETGAARTAAVELAVQRHGAEQRA